MTRVPLTELPEFVRNVRAMLAIAPPKLSSTVMTLSGNLGAGKTTFVQTLAKSLGVVDVVQSPTYVIMKSYTLPSERTERGESRKFTKLVHIDAYRLESPEEFDALRPQEFLYDPHTLVVVEWPEKLEGQLPKPDMVLKFSADNMAPDERDIDAV